MIPVTVSAPVNPWITFAGLWASYLAVLYAFSYGGRSA